MNNLTKTNNAGPSDSNGTLGKRKAEDGLSTSEGKRKATKNGSGSSAAKRKNKRKSKRKGRETRAAMYRKVCSNVSINSYCLT